MNLYKRYDENSDVFFVKKNNVKYYHLSVIYHRHDWEGNPEVNLNGYQGAVNEYSDDFNEMLKVLNGVLLKNNIKDLIVTVYENLDLIESFPDAMPFLTKKDMELSVETNWDVIMQIVKSNFYYYSHYILVPKNYEFVIEPTHNFEFLIFYDNCILNFNSDEVMLKDYY